MTIMKAIEACDILRPGNKYTVDQKKKWLSELDGRIYDQVLLSHEGFENALFLGYDENTHEGTPLLIEGAHADIYEKWLIMQVDRYNMDVSRYNSSLAAFSAAWGEMENHINKNHMPVQRARITPFF